MMSLRETMMVLVGVLVVGGVMKNKSKSNRFVKRMQILPKM